MSLSYLCLTGVVLLWRVRTLPWLRGCVVPGCAPAGTMVVLTLRVSTEPLVVAGRRVIASGCTRVRRVLTEPKVVCARCK